MAVIGFVRQEAMEVKDGEQTREVKWLECHFRVAGLRPFKAKLSKNKRKEKDTQPDFYIYLRGNINKGDTFRDIRIGSLWIKHKEVQTGEGAKIETYMTGNIEINFKNVNVLIQKPKKYFDNEKIGFLYEIIAFLDDNKRQGFDYGDTYEPTNANISDVNYEDIPF